MQKKRLLALDVMRGLTLALMILVNTPGSWEFVYAPLLHADWHGLTPTDFVFPFFMFMVGSAMAFSIRGLESLAPLEQTNKILRRGFLLFFIGLLLSAFPFTQSLSEWRVMGVLQRIAIAYTLAAFILLYFRLTARMIVMAVILLGYWILLNLLVDTSPYSLDQNLVRQLDLWVLGDQHMWRGKGIAFDPEGILSTLPSIVSVLLGYEVTQYLVKNQYKTSSTIRLIMLSIVMIVLAVIWDADFPINKSLWTSPFVLVTTGVAVIVLVALILLDSKSNFVIKMIFNFFEIFGKNPLFIYVLSGLLATTLYLIPCGNQSLYAAIYTSLCQVFDPYLSSILFALGVVVFLWCVAWLLHKRKIIISL